MTAASRRLWQPLSRCRPICSRRISCWCRNRSPDCDIATGSQAIGVRRPPPRTKLGRVGHRYTLSLTHSLQFWKRGDRAPKQWRLTPKVKWEHPLVLSSSLPFFPPVVSPPVLSPLPSPSLPSGQFPLPFSAYLKQCKDRLLNDLQCVGWGIVKSQLALLSL